MQVKQVYYLLLLYSCIHSLKSRAVLGDSGEIYRSTHRPTRVQHRLREVAKAIVRPRWPPHGRHGAAAASAGQSWGRDGLREAVVGPRRPPQGRHGGCRGVAATSATTVEECAAGDEQN